jgi:hypothetical protein
MRGIIKQTGTLTLMLMLATCGQSNVPTNDGYRPAAAESRRELCVPDEETREKVKETMLLALDEALKDQIVHVFSVWMKDDTDQPRRARTGVEQAIDAYLKARKNALAWTPPICKSQ